MGPHGEGAVSPEDVGVAEEGHRLRFAADVVEIGPRFFEIDGFDCDNRGVQGKA